jgi:hypothetical protein
VLYCPDMKRNLKSAELEAWPGFKYDVVLQDKQLMLQLDLCYLLVRPSETANDLIQDCVRQRPLDAKEKQEQAIRLALIGQ